MSDVIDDISERINIFQKCSVNFESGSTWPSVMSA